MRFSHFAGAAATLFALSIVATAKDVGADPPFCPICALLRSATSSALSRTEGNVTERTPVAVTKSSSAPTVSISAVYNSYNADGSRAVLDTVLGYGWTHSYNVFLFNQFGALFRFDGSGRVTKYGTAAGGTFVTAPGYFETLTKSGSNYTITEKDQTTYTFSSIPGSPISVGGPVYQLTSVVDRNGNTTTLTYSGGVLTSVSDTYGRTTTFTYNTQKHVSSITDPAGRVTQFTYNSTGHLLSQITDPTGHTITYSYNALYQMTGKTDRAGRTFSYTYNSAYEPISIKDSNNMSEATLSNPVNWATNATSLAAYETRVYTPTTTTNTDGRGNAWTYQYDSNGYILQQTNPDGSVFKYTYDPNTLQLASMTDADGNTTSNVYDSEGNLIQTTDALHHVTTYTYEPVFNMMTTETDPLGRVTKWTYDSHGNRLQETDPLSNIRTWTYDSHGNVLTATDKNGNTTTFQYDSDGDLVKATDPLGNITTWTYDAVGNQLSTIDADGHTTSWQYDGLNRLIKTTDPDGSSSMWTYDGEGNKIQVTDFDGHVTNYQFDLRQRLSVTTDALSQNETYSWDGNDNRITVTDRDGHTTTYFYDSQNRLNQITDALGNSSKTVYDGVGNVTSETDANGHTTRYTYDALNRRATITDAAGDVTTNQYDTGTLPSCAGCGVTPGSSQITGQTDANGKVTYWKYDALDRTIDVVQKVGSTADTITANDAVTTTVYDPVGNRLSVTEPDGNTTTIQYDADNRPAVTTNAAGDVTSATYDPVGNVATFTSPNLNVTVYTYDALNRVVQVNDSIGLVGTNTYDPDGNRLSQDDGNGNLTSYQYDAINRIVVITDSLAKTTTTAYDPVGNPLSSTDRNGNITTNSFDAINRRVSVTDALGYETQYQYDSVGNLIGLTDANSDSTSYTYDVVNRLLTEAYADGTARNLAYDRVGNVLSRTDADGRTTAYAYNDLYFLLSRTYPSSVNDSFTYDLSGRVLTADHGSWPITFSYDGADRLTQTVQNTETISYAYNIPGRTRTITYPGGRVITENTDARTRMDHINDSSSPPPIVQYAYDAGDRVTSRAYRNGVTAAFSYNANDWTTGIQHTTASSTLIAGFNYAYDNEANKQYEQKLHDPTHSETYRYDATYRLINYSVGTLTGSTIPVPSTQTSYNLDGEGNWVSKTTNSVTQTRVHNKVNEITEINSTGLTYDAAGSLLNDGSYTYTYDEENRLLTATRDSDLALVGQYQYDALGRRVQSTANASGTPVTTQYFYDHARTIEEQVAGATTATYVYGNFVDEILTMIRSGNTYYYHQNAAQSVEAITDTNGNPVERYTYDAYGAVTVTDGSFNPIAPNTWGTPHSLVGNPYLFTGRQLDEETGLYYYRGRMYDSAKGRFLQRDPLDYTDSTNLYEYGRDNPLSFGDPFGWAADYSKLSREELLKLWEKLVYSRPRLEILAGINPDSSFARNNKITPDKVQNGKEELQKVNQQIEDLKKEFAKRGIGTGKACPAAAPGQDPCGALRFALGVAVELDIRLEAISNVEAIVNIATLYGYTVAKPAVAAGEKLTRDQIEKLLEMQIVDALNKASVAATSNLFKMIAQDLGKDVLNPQKLCVAYAACEANANNKPAGFWERHQAFGRTIRSCSWKNGVATWYKSGWLVNLKSWLGVD